MIELFFDNRYAYLFILLIILIAAGITWAFYFFRFNSFELNRRQKTTLSVLRFSVLFIIGVLLLNPVIKTITKKLIKPVIVIANDNSASIALATDTVLLNQYNNNLAQLSQKLAQKYKVINLLFADTVFESDKPLYNRLSTNFVNLFNQFNLQYFGQNIGALIIGTDGIYNSGTSPLQLAGNYKFPVYTIALGDTLQKTDISIKNVDYNKTVYAGVRFPVIVSVKAFNLAGKQAKVELFKGTKLIDTKNLNIDKTNFFDKVPFMVLADTTGLYDYNINVTQFIDETNIVNNKKTFIVNVKNEKLKILILKHGPHPDISAINQALENHPAFITETKNIDSINNNISGYALIILHQLPSAKYNAAVVLKKALSLQIPMWFIIGQNTSVNALNQLNIGLWLAHKNQSYDEVTGNYNQKFALFTTFADNLLLNSFQPMVVPYGDYGYPPAANVLLYQKLGDIETQKPLWFFTQTANNKYGFLCGEGLWRWRLSEYSTTNNFLVTNDLITKTVQYLALKTQRQRFVIETPDVINTGNAVKIIAKLFNAANQPVNTPEVLFKLTDKQNNEYKYSFIADGDFYSLNLGSLQPGKYNFEANTQLGNDKFEKKGVLIVEQSFIENYSLVANHRLLYQLAKQQNGIMVYQNQINNIYQHIINNNHIKTVSSAEKTFYGLINSKLIFVILLLLLIAEWFLRKLWGLV